MKNNKLFMYNFNKFSMNNLKLKFLNYLNLIAWFINDSICRNKIDVLWVFLLGLFGIIFQIKVFALIIYYSKYFSSGNVIHFYNLEFDPRSSFCLLFSGFSAVIFLCLSSIFINLSKTKIIFLSRKYEEFCAQRVYSLFLNCICFDYGANCLNDVCLVRLIRSDSRVAGRVLRLILSLIIPVLSLSVSFFVLLFIEFKLTLLVCILGFVFVYFQYFISKSAAIQSMRFEKMSPRVAAEIKMILRRYKEFGPSIQNDRFVINAYNNGFIKNQLDAYEQRLRAVENSRLVSGVFMAIVLGIVTTIMGFSIVHENSGWGKLLVYLGALRFVLSNLQTTFSILTNINRFHPQFSRYRSFIVMSQPVSLVNIELSDPRQINFVKYHHSSNIVSPSFVNYGDRFALVSLVGMNYYVVVKFIKELISDGGKYCQAFLNSSRFVSSRHHYPDISLLELFDLPVNSTWSDVPLPQNALTRMKSLFPRLIDGSINSANWDKIDTELKFVLYLSSAIRSNGIIIFVEERGFRSMSRESRLYFDDLLADKVLIIVYTGEFNSVGKYNEKGVAIVDDNNIVKIGSIDWFSTIKNDIKIRYSQLKSKNGVACSISDDDEMDDDY